MSQQNLQIFFFSLFIIIGFSFAAESFAHIQWEPALATPLSLTATILAAIFVWIKFNKNKLSGVAIITASCIQLVKMALSLLPDISPPFGIILLPLLIVIPLLYIFSIPLGIIALIFAYRRNFFRPANSIVGPGTPNMTGLNNDSSHFEPASRRRLKYLAIALPLTSLSLFAIEALPNEWAWVLFPVVLGLMLATFPWSLILSGLAYALFPTGADPAAFEASFVYQFITFHLSLYVNISLVIFLFVGNKSLYSNKLSSDSNIVPQSPLNEGK